MKLEPLLRGKTASKRAQIKAKALAELPTGSFETDGFRVEMQSIQEIVGGVEILARAWRGGKQLGFGKDGSVDIERFRIFNPPILIDDPLGDIVEERENPFGVRTVRVLKEDPIQAIVQALVLSIQAVGKESGVIEKGKIGRTTSTFYGASGTGFSGFGTGLGVSDWSSGRSLSAGNFYATSDIFLSNGVNGPYINTRGFVPFDTSAIPDGDAISSATLYLTQNATSGSVSTNRYLCMVGPTSQASTSSLVADDFDQCGTLNSPSEWATRKGEGDYTTGNSVGWALNATGLSNISKTGFTMLGIRMHLDVDNTAPTDYTFRQFNTSAASGTANDPTLVVEHSAATSSSALLLLGVG